MFHPFGSMFGLNGEDEDDEVGADSSSEDLWEEVQNLRRKLRESEKKVDRTEAKLQQVIEAKTLDGKPVLVIEGAVEYDDVKALAETWQRFHPTGAVLAVPPGMKLQDFSDKDLESVGLKRVSRQPLTEQDLYNEMLKGQ